MSKQLNSANMVTEENESVEVEQNEKRPYRPKMHLGNPVVKQYDDDDTVVSLIESALIQSFDDAKRLAYWMNEAYENGKISVSDRR